MVDYQAFLDSINKEAYHAGELTWEEDGYTCTRTYHYSPPGCHSSCGVIYYVKDNQVCKIEGDPLDPCTNGKLCMRCLENDECFNHPDRVKYPMRRVGERGENKWERITWDEAFDEIEAHVREVWEKWGGPSILHTHGTGRNINWQTPYFAHSALKTPNDNHIGFTGFACYLPRTCGATAPMGDFPIADASEGHELRYADPSFVNPALIVVWGNEPLASNADGYIGHWLAVCVQNGSKIISIDPRLTWWGVRAEYFLQIRPGTDPALAMAWLNVIINEDLYDHEFVELWCAYFDELAESVADKTPAWASEITGIPEEDIIGSARLFAASKPATLQWGLAFDQQMAAMALNLAAVDLMAITGNVDVPGGWLLVHNAFECNGGYASGDENVPPEWMAQKATNNYVLKTEGIDFVACASADALLYCIEVEDPYPIKMWWIESSNEIACAAMDAPRLYEALKKIPFVVNADPFITPTSVAFADILLPVAMSCERDSARTWRTPLRTMTKVTSYYEAKTDEEITFELGKRLAPENYPWDTVEDFINWFMTPADYAGGWGVESSANEARGFHQDFHYTHHDIERHVGHMGGTGYMYDEFCHTYRKFEKGMLRPDGQPGFATPSGRIELASRVYEVWGLDPVPFHREPVQSPLSTPELMDEYPLILTCGGRSYEFFHSENRQLQTSREFHPWPLLTINPKTAEKYGIREGEWVWVETDRGRFRQKAFLRPTVNEQTVHAEHAWWFPEEDGAEPNLFGTFKSNPNNVTRQFEIGQGGVGSSIKSMICKIYPYKEGDEMPEDVVARGGWNKIIPGQA